jgi:tetratricopeptide (TPR) repeat protein
VSSEVRTQLQETLGTAYTLERELGGGGMSRVFVAEETALRRKVVVKVLPPELTAGVNVDRFNREILLAAGLQHPHIVPVLAAGETHGLPYYTMPFVEGESLRARLAKGALGITEVTSILKDVARALAYAHERGIVHRDIKPDNVLLTGGSATVTDFGIAKAISASRTAAPGATLTQVGTSIGTPTYMAPEQAAGDPTTDHRADIYSFGCMAYELLAGRPPFTDMQPRKLLAAHMGEKPQQVTDFRPDAPPALADLVMRCLAKEADDRPQQATDLVRVIETVTSSGSGQAMPQVLLGGSGMFRKALALYAVAFVVVAIVAKAAIVGIGLPDWVFPGSLIVMALGLPVVLWTGYVQRVARRAMVATPTYTPGGTPSIVQGTIATMALRAAPKVSWYRTAKGGAYAFGAFIAAIALFMAMRAFGIGPFGSLIASGQFRAQEPLIMTDFTVSSGDTSLARVVSFAVRTALGQSKVITVMSQAGVAGALERMDRAPNERVSLAIAQGIALREGVKAIVDGDVSSVGGGYVVTLRLLTTDSSRVLASVQATGTGPQGLIEAADKVARDLRAKAGESLRSVQGTVPLVRARTASLEALRKYSEAATANDVENAPGKAIPLLREAVALDTNFAEGWRKLAVAMNNLGLPRASIDSVFSRAYRLRSRLPDGEQAAIEATYFGEGIHRDRVRAIAAYERAMQLSGFRGNNLANILNTRREYARAESLYRADIARDSTFSISQGNLIRTLLNQGRLDAADSAVRVARRRFPRDASLATYSLTVSAFKGQTAEAERVADSLRRTTKGPDLSTAYDQLAVFALMQGQLGKWRQYRAQRATNDSLLGRRTLAASEVGMEGWALASIKGVGPEYLQRYEAAVRAVPRNLAESERPDIGIAMTFAAAGQPARAREVLNGYVASLRDTALLRVSQPDIHTARGMIALAEKKFPEAVAEIRRGDELPDGPANECGACTSMLLARAFDAAQAPDSAIARYEQYVSTPFAFRLAEFMDGPMLPTAHERLGQLYDAKGDAAKAAEHYRKFIDMWKNADPELQPRVAAARERLKKLAPVEGAKR